MKSYSFFKFCALIFSVIVLILMAQDVIAGGNNNAWFAFAGYVLAFAGYNAYNFRCLNWAQFDRIYGWAPGLFLSAMGSGAIAVYFVLVNYSEGVVDWRWLLGLVPFAWQMVYGFYVRNHVKR